MEPNWISHVFEGQRNRKAGKEPIEASWDIQGLEENEGYEARVQAKNRYKTFVKVKNTQQAGCMLYKIIYAFSLCNKMFFVNLKFPSCYTEEKLIPKM